MALDDQDPDVRAAAALSLGRIKNEDTVERLAISAVADKAWAVRRRALFALTEMNDSFTVKRLIDALMSEDAANEIIQIRAATALRKFDRLEVVDELVTALSHKKPETRSMAAFTLGWLRYREASTALFARLNDEEADVRSAAIKALARIGDTKLTEGLVALLKNPDEHFRANAAEALGRLGQISAEEYLLAASRTDQSSYVRRCAAEALGELRDALERNALIETLQSGDTQARQDAAERLGLPRLGLWAVEPLLLAARTDEDHSVRDAAAIALGQIIYQETMAFQIMLATARNHVEALRAFAEALVVVLMAGEPEEARVRAAEEITSALTNESGGWAAEALNNIDDAQAVSGLRLALKGNATSRVDAVIVLGKFSHHHAVDALANALKDGHPMVSAGAGISLGQIGNARARDVLLTALMDEKEQVRCSAVIGLGWFDDERVVDALSDILTNPTKENLHFLAAESLGEIGGAKARRALAEYHAAQA